MRFLILLLLNFSVQAQELTHHALYNSINRYHPKLLENLLQIVESEGKVQENKGEFDTKLSLKNSSRTSGYYTGDYNEAIVTQPIGALNSQIYTGYKKGTDTLPIYEQQYLTGQGGRHLIGGEVNLFRNSEIYKNSVTVLNSKMDLEKSKILYDLVRIDVLQNAMSKYWDWLAKGKKLESYKSLLRLAEKRQQALETQISHGDLPKFYAIENKQYILQRQNQVQDAQNQFAISSYELSLYFRNANGEIILINENNLPNNMPNVFQTIMFEKNFEYAKKVNPSLKLFQIAKKQLENELKIAKAQQLPKASISGALYKDTGSRPESKQKSVVKVGVNFEMPLQRRKGKGEEIQIESKKKQITQKEILLENTIFINLQSINNTIDSYTTMWHNAEEEFKIASKLVEFEKESVKHGNSNFFTLNLREQSQFHAQVKSIEFHAQLNKAYIDYFTILMAIDELFKKNDEGASPVS
jgi:hypothetical protein